MGRNEKVKLLFYTERFGVVPMLCGSIDCVCLLKLSTGKRELIEKALDGGKLFRNNVRIFH